MYSHRRRYSTSYRWTCDCRGADITLVDQTLLQFRRRPVHAISYAEAHARFSSLPYLQSSCRRVELRVIH